MLASEIPDPISTPFAESGTKATIPVAPPGTPGYASYDEGFPPITMIAKVAGGIPPRGQDMNGVLFDATAWARWQAAGGTVVHDAAFSTAIGGYPAGAVLKATAAGSGFWLSTADNNVTDPDTGGAGWVALFGVSSMISLTAAGTTSQTVPAWARTMRARVWAAGGGGGGCSALGGARGGGGGEYREGLFTVVPGASISCTVGAAGAGGTSAPTSGSAGGNSSVAALITAIGGAGGSASAGGGATGGGTGGSGGSGGTFVEPGAESQLSFVIGGDYTMSCGGPSFGHGYGIFTLTTTGTNGNDGYAAGNGGNGAAGGAATGGNGFQGRIVLEFFP